ncbi:MAG: RND family transporter [Candidatus Pelagibacterales bacterium]|jgi:predicted RND superfamily exporter protein
MLQKIENWFFKFRLPVLAAFVLITIVMAYFAVQIRMDAGFAKQLPNSHSFVKTYYEYQDDLSGTNSITVALRTTEGDIFTKEYLSNLFNLNNTIRYLPGVNQGSMQSLWTPNIRVMRVTEEGFESSEVIPGTVIPENLTPEIIENIKERILTGGHVGSIVANDFTSSLIKVELTEYNPKTGEKLDYLKLGQEIETIREQYEIGEYRVEITGFAKMISDIANEAYNVVIFFGLAFFLTVLAVYWYSRSWTLTFLPLICSLTSLIWQFGMLKILGFGLDPLAILVPFLVFAIGVSHGIQQVNQITKEVIEGETAEYAARASFSRLLVPGSMALVTDLVGFGTLILLPIGMIQELGITASIGVAFKIVTNLIMLPLAASYARYNESFATRAQSAISYRQNLMGFFGKLARPREAVITLSVSAVLFIGAVYLASERHVGDLHAGAPELRPEARFNQDINEITKRYNVTTDVLVVITEASFTGGVNPCRSTYVMDAQNNLHWYLENIPGVSKVISLSSIAKRALSGYAEGNLKWSYLPRNEQALGFATSVVDPSTGLINEQCSIMPIYVFTEDHKATTLNTVISSIEEYNEKFRELDDTITFKTLIAKPAEGTDVIPAVDSLGGEETNIEDLLNINNPKIFTDDEFTDFGYENGFNTRNIMLGPGLINYYRDIDSFDDNVNYMVGDIKQSEISFKEFFNNNPEFESIIFESDEIKNRLASGSVGIQYATNEVIEKGELPMMIIVYIVIFILVFVTYLDWRATICCTVPLTFATMLGYAFMDLAQIGLKVSTLPVMVLAVGVGVDYAFYIYNRTQTRLKEGMNITEAFEHTFANTGAAVVFTAITLAIGVSTWSFSALKFQADMGSLLTFMFLINMVCAMTTLPALAVVLDKLFPRKITSE